MRRRTNSALLAILSLLAVIHTAYAQSVPLPVTADNFIRAESDVELDKVVKANGFGKFFHNRELAPVDQQIVVRVNRDTLYSSAVFDLDAGPVTITLPDAGERFRSMIVINQDHYAQEVVYNAGRYTLDKKQIGTRYVLTTIRTLVNPSDASDLEKAHALQDAVKIEQRSVGSFNVPSWDETSQKKVRDALLILGSTLPNTRKSFGRKSDVDPVHHLIGSATLWGGNPEKDALYLTRTPSKNDGTTIYKIHVDRGVPVDGFWSITVYNAAGFIDPNPLNAYSLNNTTARKNGDGSVDIQFGGCDGIVSNCLPIASGWNYTVRLYRPRPEIVNGKWTFPDARPA
ncbi:hypothetical protein AWB80_02915 [Caballeronia pedi]|uniref:Carboxylesterase n=1 Tax=Caballeronia pedi TaxID=1777141 RepID=A0A158B160_9BURK|nr:DUF1214 domain-containing protein [Caballeronia pedi]SAK63753.1 hypothetical protein AWB80_02915 [Caballeronia pedi]